MVLQSNTSYRVLKDFWLWGCYSGVELVRGQIIVTGELHEPLKEVVEVEVSPFCYIEILVEQDFDGLLELAF